MYSPHLVVVSGPDAGRKFVLAAGTAILVGRHRECGIVLFDSSVSRRHAKLEVSADGVVLEDLGSRFGTHCNGQKVTRKYLGPGDRVQLGRVLLEYRTQPGSTGRYGPGAPPKQQGQAQAPTMRTPPQRRESYQVLQSICLNRSDLENSHLAAQDEFDIGRNMAMGNFSMVSFEADGNLRVASRKKETKPSDLQTIEDAHLKLSILYEAGKQFAKTRDLTSLFKFLVGLLAKVVNAQNVLVFLSDRKENVLRPAFAHGPEGQINDFNKVVYSRTLLNSCLTSREAVLTSDASEDERFSAGMSIVQFNFKSVMVIPLWTGDDILGVLQVDNNQAAGTFSNKDLGFATALANQAAIAIQNFNLIEDVKEEEKKRNSLSRYLSPSIVEKIIEEQGAMSLGGEKRQCNVLFSDIRGFTSLSENLPPDTVVTLLNEYFTVMTDVIFKYEGTLDKYIGDAIMAVFGSPYSREDDHLRAVHAAVDMQRGLETLKEQWKQQGRPIFDMGIGVGSGEVIAGNIGSPQRMEYTVIGDTVNTASRLCSVAGPRQIVVHPNTLDLIGDHFRTRSLGPVALKGKAEKLEIFEVLWV